MRNIAEEHYLVVGEIAESDEGIVLENVYLVKKEVDYFNKTRYIIITGQHKGKELADFSNIITLGRSNKPDNIVLFVNPQITTIGRDAFKDIKWLNTVLFLSDNNGNSCKNIGFYSFAFCENLKNLILPNDLEKIDYCAFYGCRNLNKVLSARVVDEDDVDSVKATLSSTKKLFDISTLGTNAGKLIIGENAFARCKFHKNDKFILPPLRIYSGSADDLIVEKE